MLMGGRCRGACVNPIAAGGSRFDAGQGLPQVERGPVFLIGAIDGGMEAIVSGRATSRLAQLWQLPLLLFSLGLFGYAAYLLIDPQPGPSIAQQLDVARRYVKQERADAAIALLSELLENPKLSTHQAGAARLLLGEALELGQRHLKLNIPENHRRIIRQTELGLASGIEPEAQTHRRLAESYEALGRPTEAIFHYRKAMILDADLALKWHRRIIELQLLHDLHEAAVALDEYLVSPGLTASERAWAMGEKAHVLVDQGDFAKARRMLADALKLNARELVDQGQFNYWIGYCEWKLGNLDEAERFIRVARDLLRVQHPLDADAAYALGRIRQQQKDHREANSFFATVMTSHSDSRVAQPARLGRGVSRIGLGEEEAGLTDLQDVVRYIKDRPTVAPALRDEAISALRQASQLLSENGRYEGALEVMALEQVLLPKPAPEFFARIARLFEKRADQVEAAAGSEESEYAARLALKKARELRGKAGDAFVAHAKALTLKDDAGHGQSLWKAVELYDAAADLPRVISAIEMFAAERPSDPQTPEALLRLGHAYHAAGLLDKAIASYKHCQFRYPKSLAASKAGVPLARAYVAKGPDTYRRAEEVLRAVIDDNPQITPEAQEFAEALIELAQLYHRTGRYEPAIAKLEEATRRYPDDERMGQLLFIMADGYRKSATILEDRIRTAQAAGPATQPAVDVAEAAKARNDRLARARDLYFKVIEYYRTGGATKDVDRMYLKLAHFYRADCVYGLGQYAEAIRLYDDAAFRYQDDPSALAAYVQIVNANVALGRDQEAKAANERAKWMLRRMPREMFESSGFALSKQQWEQWLQWSGESGMWK